MNRNLFKKWFRYFAVAFCAGLLSYAGFPQGYLAGNSTNPFGTKVPFARLIDSKAKADKGMLTFYTTKGHYYLRLQDTILNRPILVVSRILQSSAGTISQKDGAYSGDQLGESDITFDKANNKINIRNVVFADRASDTSANGLSRAVGKNNLPPIVMSFDIKANGPDSASYIIDVTDFITGNNNIMTGRASGLNFQGDKSFLEDIKSFPTNTEIRAFKTYGTGRGDTTETVRINTSFVLLPATLMRERFLDPRIGYFTPYNFDFDRDPQKARMELKIARWRLEPKPGDLEKYRRGELVEPVKPIIFYIDPATPRQWVPYLKQGVEDWQAAFEKAGFKKAILAREVSPEDTDWSMDDARYSVIVYKPSFITNAMGPSISDPRTGEIMESHVSWYHNVMTLLHNWYLMQAGLLDTAAQKAQFSTELMGQLIRFVSSHEIGHTLGLKHNFGSSSTVPVDSLRSKVWVDQHGHTPSIMDYARFNYVAQPEDHIPRSGIFPRINDYDKWAIEWGYRVFPDIKDINQERRLLFDLVTDSLKHNPRLYYGDQGFFGVVDPRCQSEDLSNDVITANTYGIKNLRRIAGYLPGWVSQTTDMFGTVSGNNLKRTYPGLLMQFFNYQMHAVNCIGSGYYNNLTTADTGDIFTPAPKALQSRAMNFLNKELFRTEPVWIMPDNITGKIWDTKSGMVTQLIASDVLTALLIPQKLINIYNASIADPGRAYPVEDFLRQLDDGLWADVTTAGSVGSYHQLLHEKYLEMMSATLLTTGNLGLSAIIRSHLAGLQRLIERRLPMVTDEATKYHYENVLIELKRMNAAL